MTQDPMRSEGQDESGRNESVRDESVRDVWARLYTDGRAYAEAEVERQKLRAGIIGAGVREALILAGVSIILIFASLVASMVGGILFFAPLVGMGWAICIVVGGGLLPALILLLFAKGRIDRMKKAVKS